MKEKEINKELNKLSNKVLILKQKRTELNAKVRFEEHKPKYDKMYKEIMEADKYINSFAKKISGVMNEPCKIKYSVYGGIRRGKYSVSLSLKSGWFWSIVINDLTGDSLFGNEVTRVEYDTHTKDKKKHKVPSTLSKAIELYGIDTPEKLEALYHAIDNWDILKKELYDGECGIYDFIKTKLDVYDMKLDRDLKYVEEQLSS